MPHNPVKERETFLKRGSRLCWRNVRRQRDAIRRWKDNAVAASDTFFDWLSEHQVAVALISTVTIGAAVTYTVLWPTLAAREGRSALLVVGCITFLGALLVLACLALSFLLLSTGSLALTARLLIACVSFVGAALCVLWFILHFLGQVLLVVPLFGLFLTTRSIQLWRGIFFTCPSRQCSYRGLPAYVCPQCGRVYDKLWPSRYGVLCHHCTQCDHKLPTLDCLGRSRLKRRCGNKNCRIPLLGRHSGRAPERLVALIGGPDSGKTCYLHMAVGQIVNGNGQLLPMRGRIDDPEQEEEFEAMWPRFIAGNLPSKTVAVPKAFQMYVRVGRKPCQLYLYDAPGEEFTSFAAMSRQRYAHLIEGFILLVDPMSFEAVAGPALSRNKTSLLDVVSSTLGTCLSGMEPGKDGRFATRAAVVISKADLPVVRSQIGAPGHREGSSAGCREALVAWGASGAIRALETHFTSVAYFTCSALGRDAGTQLGKPFQGSGLLEPLYWILKKANEDGFTDTSERQLVH
jgi:hypothetical protein